MEPGHATGEPADPQAAQALLESLAEGASGSALPTLRTLAETCQALALHSNDRRWCNVTISAFRACQLDNSPASRIEEMSARLRLMHHFGPDPDESSLSPKAVLTWLGDMVGNADAQYCVRRSKELLDNPRPGSEAWLSDLRRVRELKRVALLAKGLGSVHALPPSLAEWADAADAL